MNREQIDMGWKSTTDITREEAIRLIQKKSFSLEHLSNKELEDMVENLGYGDETGQEYYGHNFNVEG